jgi:FemAB-related protein (PEP-CTERM system-associated)
MAPGHATGGVELLSRTQELARAPITVQVLDPSGYKEWDDFVLGHEHASPFHLIAWKKVIEETYGFPSMYLAARRGGRIVGILPLFSVKNITGKTVLMSTPFAVYGGILAADVDVRTAIAEHLKQIAFSMKVDYVELRNVYVDQCAGFSRVSRYVSFFQEIDQDEKTNLEKIPRKTRAAVRKGLKEGFTTFRRTDPSPDFEEIYARNLRRLGTPCFPRKHFEKIMQHFSGMVDIREVKDGDKVVAAVLTLYFRDRILPYYGASDQAYNPRCPNNYMYFDLLRWGSENGYSVFDFGRSKKAGSGSYDFKAHWGMMELELPYEMLLVRRKELPNFSPNNPVFDLPMKLWRKMPLGLTRAIGPMFLRFFA